MTRLQTMRLRITGVDKSPRSEAWERITHIGGPNSDGTYWKLTQKEAIAGIAIGRWAFYVSVDGHDVNVLAANQSGNEYIKTEVDGEFPDLLLTLPRCREPNQ